MTIPILAGSPKYFRGTRVLPTTDSGWATYNAGSRLFLPAATNLLLYPTNIALGIWGVSGYTTFASGLSDNSGTLQATLYETASSGNVWTSVALAPNTTYTVSFYIKAKVKCTTYIVAIWDATIGNHVYAQHISDLSTSAWVRIAETFTTPAAVDANTQIQIMRDADCDVWLAHPMLEQSSVLEPYFDGSYPNCAWTGAADASTSTRTASDLLRTNYVEITSAGVVAAGTKVAYAHNPSAGYYGPVVVTDNAKSGPWQTAFAAMGTQLNAIWNTLVATDMLLPLSNNGTGWVKR